MPPKHRRPWRPGPVIEHIHIELRAAARSKMESARRGVDPPLEQRFLEHVLNARFYACQLETWLIALRDRDAREAERVATCLTVHRTFVPLLAQRDWQRVQEQMLALDFRLF